MNAEKENLRLERNKLKLILRRLHIIEQNSWIVISFMATAISLIHIVIKINKNEQFIFLSLMDFGTQIGTGNIFCVLALSIFTLAIN